MKLLVCLMNSQMFSTLITRSRFPYVVKDAIEKNEETNERGHGKKSLKKLDDTHMEPESLSDPPNLLPFWKNLICARTQQYYGYLEHVEPERKCDETRYPENCSFQVTKSGDHELICDAEVCGSSHPKIGFINLHVGKY